MLRRATVLVAPLLSTALLVGVTPAFAQEPTAPGAAGIGQEPVEGQGPTTPGPLYDETTAAVEPAAEPVPDGTVEVRVVAGRWTRAGELPVRVRGVQGSPGTVRVTFSTGADVADRGGAAAVLVERVDGSDVPAPVRVAVDTDALGGVFKANFVHRLRLATSRACVALLHPHEDQGNHKSRAYAYGKGKHCPTSDPVDVPITDDLGDGDLEFDAVAGADEEATEEAPEPTTPDQTPEPSTAPSPDPRDAPDAGTSSETTSQTSPETSPEEPTTAPTQTPAESGSPEPKGDNGVRDHGAGEGRQGSPKASLRSGTASGGTAYLLSAGPSGSAGSFAATPLAPSASWQVGEQSGNFSTSYPVPLPPAPAGEAPEVALSYSSQSVDGRTSATNNQASWVGLGWDYAPGSIQRRYGACADDGHPSFGDLCWKTDNAVLSLGGRTVALYRAANGLWHPAEDDGVRVQRLTGAVNGARGGEHWVVTDRDGTRYTFGLGRQATTNLPTGSTWTVPVFGDDTGEPCHASTFAASRCNQAWTWNLDRITDTRGNSTTFFYAPETNRYGRLASPGLYTTYTRGGTLSRIEYGHVAGHENSPAPARVVFGTALRCNAAVCSAPTTANAASYPDVPVDLICADTFCAKQYTPVFFDTRRLATITTQVRSGAAYRTIDALTLSQSFPSPGDGTDPTLWLSSITRTGYGAGTKTSLPAVVFGGQRLANRVDSSTALGVVPLNMYRVKTVKGELGAVTTVSYGRPRPCVKTALPSPASNTRDCYPAYWVPEFGPAGFGWFHKYLVTSVTVTDPVAGGPAMLTRYGYLGGAAWHHDENPIDPAKTQSFGSWRGYGTTNVTTGSAVRSTTRSLWFRGMNGDPLPGGAVRTARVTDSAGTALADSAWLAGRLRETRQLNTAGIELTGSLTGYYAKRTVDGPGLYDAYVVLPNRVDDRTRVTDPNTAAVTVRRTQESTVYDATFAQPSSVTARGDLATTTDDVCVLTSYVRNTSAWVLNTPNVAQVRAGGCTGAVLSRTEHYYDGHTLTAAPSRGEQTQTRAFSTATAFVRTDVAYDARGRVTSTTDGNRRTSRTTLTEAYPYGPVTATTGTNPLGHTSSATIDPGRGVVTSSTDANGHRTSAGYDALGRLVKVWLPGQADATPSRTYSYAVRQNAPSTMVSAVRQDAGTALRQSTVLDALGRTVETSEPVDGGRAVVQTRYDDRGLVAATTAPLFTDTALTALLRPALTAIPSETRASYDELGRPTRTALWSNGIQQHATVTTHYGGATRTTPPVGTPTTTYQDALGRTTRLEQRLGSKVLPTRYGYDRLGRLLTVTDTGANVSRFTYDLLGRQTATTTPDAGTTSTHYDANSNPVTTTDARGVTVTTAYDPLDRPTHRSSSTGTTLALFTYDAPGAVGLPASSTTADGFVARVDTYDNRDRPTSRTLTAPDTQGQLAGSWTTSLAYDEVGHVTTVQLPAVADLPAEQLSTTYDAYGRPDTTTGLEPYVSDTAYDEQGRVERRTLGSTPNALLRSYHYTTTTGRLDRLSATGPTGQLQDDQIVSDPVGNITRVTDVQGQRQCNRYDSLNRLVRAWTSSTDCTDESAPTDSGVAPYDLHYTLADTGQILARTHSGATRTYTYGGPRPHAVTNTGGQDYTYDSAGQLTARTGTGDDLTATWNPEGTIAKTTVIPDIGPTIEETYGYSTSGIRILRRGGADSVLDLGGTELTLTGDTLTARRYYTSGGSVVAVRTAAGLSWLLSDRQGGPALTVAADGTVKRQLFGPYGEQRIDDKADTLRGFLNKPHDTSTGLTVLDHRSYDAELARLLSPDPIFQPFRPGTFDAYAYGDVNPTTVTDPTGLMGCGPFSGVCNKAKSAGKTLANTVATVGNDVIDLAYTVAEGYTNIGVLVTGGTEPARFDRPHIPTFAVGGLSAKISRTLAFIVELAAPAAATVKAARSFGVLAKAEGVGAAARTTVRNIRPTRTNQAPTLAAGVPPAGKIAAAEGAGAGKRAIVIGEDMEGRVIPRARELGADVYKPPSAPASEWMENNRKWINDRMDEGCTIYVCGAAPGRANYPNPTSPYYQMELDEIAKRGYPTTWVGGSG